MNSDSLCDWSLDKICLCPRARTICTAHVCHLHVPGYGLAVGTILGQGSTVKRLGRTARGYGSAGEASSIAGAAQQMSIGEVSGDMAPFRASKDGDSRGKGEGSGVLERQTTSSAGILEGSRGSGTLGGRLVNAYGDGVTDIVRRQGLSQSVDAGRWLQQQKGI